MTLSSIVESRWFQRTILGVILLAAVLAGLETSRDLMAAWGPVLKTLDRVVLSIFVVEILLRLAAFGRRPLDFFKDGWNVFDFVVVLVSVIPAGTQFTAVLRLVRVVRVLRLVTAIPKLRLLVSALLRSVSAMGYVGLLLGLMMYVYGVMGVHLFGKNDPLHFGSLGNALISLFQVITLENWASIYATQKYGSAAQGYEGMEHLIVESQAQPAVATLYFISFILLGTMIMLNLFIGVIMNSMTESNAELEGEKNAAHPQPPGSVPIGNRPVLEQLRLLERQLQEMKHGIDALRIKLDERPEPAPALGLDRTGENGQLLK